MSMGIQQQISSIHQQVKDFVEMEHQGYRVFAIRNCSTTFYAEQAVSTVEMNVNAVRADKELRCRVSVRDDVISIVRAKESECSPYD